MSLVSDHFRICAHKPSTRHATMSKSPFKELSRKKAICMRHLATYSAHCPYIKKSLTSCLKLFIIDVPLKFWLMQSCTLWSAASHLVCLNALSEHIWYVQHWVNIYEWFRRAGWMVKAPELNLVVLSCSHKVYWN